MDPSVLRLHPVIMPNHWLTWTVLPTSPSRVALTNRSTRVVASFAVENSVFARRMRLWMTWDIRVLLLRNNFCQTIMDLSNAQTRSSSLSTCPPHQTSVTMASYLKVRSNPSYLIPWAVLNAKNTAMEAKPAGNCLQSVPDVDRKIGLYDLTSASVTEVWLYEWIIYTFLNHLFTAASVSESATAKVFCDGLIVNLNPRSPGSCQYVSVCDQLDIICGITIDHEALREMCVQFMEANPTFTDSQTHTEAFIPLSDDSTANWEILLEKYEKTNNIWR